MAKNKKLFTYFSILLVVVVVGAAVYLGSPKNQRGAFPGLPRMPQRQQGDIRGTTIIQPLITHYVSPSRINPSAQTAEVATIYYRVNQRLNGLSLSIYNSASQSERTIFVNNSTVAAGSYSAIWNGRSSTGTIAPSGLYTYRFVLGGQNIGSGTITVNNAN